MLCFLFVYGDAVHRELSPDCPTVNKQYCLDVIKHWQGAVKGKRPNSRRGKKWMLQHNKGLKETRLNNTR
jgi:hypothetical protein